MSPATVRIERRRARVRRRLLLADRRLQRRIDDGATAAEEQLDD